MDARFDRQEKREVQTLFGLKTLEGKDEWLTPPQIIKTVGPFDLDPCAPINRPWEMAANHYTVIDNGLNMPWAGRVWCNPPYGTQTGLWLAKRADLCPH